MNLRDYYVWCKSCVLAEQRRIIEKEVEYQVKLVRTMEEEGILLEKGRLILNERDVEP